MAKKVEVMDEPTLQGVMPLSVPRPANPMTLLERAIEKGLDTAQLEKLMELQERWQKNQAAEAFGVALARFQAECPTVFKRRTATIKTDKGGYDYKFASLDDVMREATPVLARCGISVGFDTHQDEKGMLTVVCRIRVGSHFEDKKFTCPIPAQMRVSDSQQYGAALSFAKRYAICAALNIVATDTDNDGNSLMEYVSQAECDELDSLIIKKGVDIKRFLEWAQAESLAKLPKKQFGKAVAMLKNKPDAKGGAA